MATEVKQVFGRRGSGAIDGAISISRFFKLKSDTALSEEQVLFHSDIPQYFEPLSTIDSGASPSIICQKKVASMQDDDPMFWEIEVQYGMQDQNDRSNPIEDPTDRPALVEYDSISYRIQAKYAYKAQAQEVDRNGDPTSNGDIQTFSQFVPVNSDSDKNIPILNTLEERFQDPPIRQRNKRRLRITRNEEQGDFNPNTIELFEDTINIKEITIAGIEIPKACGRMLKIKASRKWYTDKYGNYELYFRVVYEIEIDKEEGQFLKVLNNGFNALNSNSPHLIYPIYTDSGKLVLGQHDNTSAGDDGDGKLIEEPAKLDLNGHLIKPTYEKGTWYGTPKSKSIWLYFQTEPAKDWSSLGLPKNKDGK